MSAKVHTIGKGRLTVSAASGALPLINKDTTILVVLVIFSIGNAYSPRLREAVPIIDGLLFDSCVKPCQFETEHIKILVHIIIFIHKLCFSP